MKSESWGINPRIKQRRGEGGKKIRLKEWTLALAVKTRLKEGTKQVETKKSLQNDGRWRRAGILDKSASWKFRSKCKKIEG